jgi:hypothetical protein
MFPAFEHFGMPYQILDLREKDLQPGEFISDLLHDSHQPVDDLAEIQLLLEKIIGDLLGVLDGPIFYGLTKFFNRHNTLLKD